MTFSDWLSIISILLPIVAGTLKFKLLSFEFKVFYCFVLIAFLTEIISYYVNLKNQNNLILMNVYSLIEAEFLVVFLSLYCLPKKRIGLAITLGLIFLAIWAYSMVDAGTIKTISSTFKSFTSIVISCLAGYGLFSLSNRTESNIFTHPLFWIQTGVLIYFFGTLFIFYTLNWHDGAGNSVAEFTYDIHSYLNFIYNLTQAIAFWMFRKTKTFTF